MMAFLRRLFRRPPRPKPAPIDMDDILRAYGADV
jgi:hypothetical protein